MEGSQYDVIVVGLGCAGLSTTQYLSKYAKWKVLGLEKYPKSGDLGSSTYAHARIWRYIDKQKKYVDMQHEAMEVWRDVEKECNQELLVKSGLVIVKNQASQAEIKDLISQGMKQLSKAELHKMFPSFQISEEEVALWTQELGGHAKVQVALECFKQVSEKYGAELRYNAEVKEIDHANRKVVMRDGSVFWAKRGIVVTCGATSDQFYQYKSQFKMYKQPINCLQLKSNYGLPSTFIIEDIPGVEMIYSTPEGPNFDLQKIGVEFVADLHDQFQILKRYIPNIQEQVYTMVPCYYSMADEFIFEKKGSTVYGFGLSGRGFKHMGYHGKRIYHLLTENFKEADKFSDQSPKL